MTNRAFESLDLPKCHIWDSEREGEYSDYDLSISFRQEGWLMGRCHQYERQGQHQQRRYLRQATPDGKYTFFNRV